MPKPNDGDTLADGDIDPGMFVALQRAATAYKRVNRSVAFVTVDSQVYRSAGGAGAIERVYTTKDGARVTITTPVLTS